MALTIILNGQSRDFAALSESASLADLVQELGLKADRVAVEHNGEIAAKAGWPNVRLTVGDRLEIVHFVGGGWK
ncbi:sulfur carrier protein ThiS [Edaphobacter flagellatus]|uniref:sulfur carrier protein ThiS n=1 Tax=Edaphobacter flagellatus TaxID=1933044 RepID=UPI0021B49779|nr:sulfur carrier protein ThiS [Edaphobacter flagellatus]